MTSPVLSRRRFLAGSAAACAAGSALPLLRPRLAFAEGEVDHLLVVVDLAGGLDGLSALVPAGDVGYGRARSSTRVAETEVIPVDPQFGLHPQLAPLAELWVDGLVAAIPAVGTTTGTRSHFAEMAVVAQGTGGAAGDGSGWLARHLLTRSGGAAPTLQGVACGPDPALELAGHGGAFHVPDLASAGLGGWGVEQRDGAEAALAAAYAAVPRLAAPAAVAVDALDRLRASGAAAVPSLAAYEGDPWSAQLRQVAQLARAEVGVEAAVVTFGGWDTHRAQGGAGGQLAQLLDRLARALASFAADLHDRFDQITVVVLSEFGRRVAENGSGGTDHGRGGLALVLGGGLRGGVHGTWPGLDDDALDAGDLAVATDVRAVLAEVVSRRLGNPALDEVFPGFSPVPLGFA